MRYDLSHGMQSCFISNGTEGLSRCSLKNAVFCLEIALLGKK